MEPKQRGAATAPIAAFQRPLNVASQREKYGLSLEDVADRTKISMFFLKAIEAAEYGKLPGGIYRTSYLRQYAAAIGFDVHALLADAQAVIPSPCEEPAEYKTGFCRGFLDRWFGLPAPDARPTN